MEEVRLQQKRLQAVRKRRMTLPPVFKLLLSAAVAFVVSGACFSLAFVRRPFSPSASLNSLSSFPLYEQTATPFSSVDKQHYSSGVKRQKRSGTAARFDVSSSTNSDLPDIFSPKERRVRLSASNSPTAVLPLKAASLAPATSSAQPLAHASSSSPVPSPSPSQQESFFSKSLKGLLRGHKCLFDDSHLPNGNLAFLFRGADSSQRYVYPLELKTNSDHLPGAAAAKTMFDLRDAAIATAREAVFGVAGGEEKQQQRAKSAGSSVFRLRSDDRAAGELLYEDIARFHRVLQYGVAAGLSSFMRHEVLEYNADLYAELGMNMDAVIAALDAFGEFYSKHITGDQWDKAFNPALQSVVRLMRQMKESLSKRRQAGETTGVSPTNQMPRSTEAPADPRTMTPLLVPNAMAASEADRPTS